MTHDGERNDGHIQVENGGEGKMMVFMGVLGVGAYRSSCFKLAGVELKLGGVTNISHNIIGQKNCTKKRNGIFF